MKKLITVSLMMGVLLFFVGCNNLGGGEASKAIQQTIDQLTDKVDDLENTVLDLSSRIDELEMQIDELSNKKTTTKTSGGTSHRKTSGGGLKTPTGR